MTETSSKVNPLMATAAIAVIIFSAVGVGVMTGVIPSSKSSMEVPAQTAAAPDTKAAAKPEAKPEVKAAPAPAYKAPVAQKRAPPPVSKPQQVAVNEPTAAAPVPSPVARICTECGVIDVINVIEKKGDGSGLGAVGGAVVGGLLGSQVGRGRGKTAATVVGVVGGGFAGNEIEKHVKSVNEYQVTVRMNDGTSRRLTFDSAPDYVVGEKVKIVDGRIVKG